MNAISNLSTMASDFNITTEMLIVLCLTEFLMLALIGLAYLFRKNKKLKKVIVSLQTVIRTKKSETSQPDQITAYLKEQLSLSKLQQETLANSKHPEENSAQHIEALSERLVVLNSELLTLTDYISNGEDYWPGIYSRYAGLGSEAQKSLMETDINVNSTDIGTVDSLEEIEPIDKNMLVSFGEIDEEFTPVQASELGAVADLGSEMEISDVQNAQELNLVNTASEEIGRLKDILSRQYNSIDELKFSISDVQALGVDYDKQIINEKLSLLNNQTDALLSEQEQLNMCIDILEKENLRLSEELLQFRASIENNNTNTFDDNNIVSQPEIDDLIQTNKEQLQCIAILEDEISSIKAKSSEGQIDSHSVSNQADDEKLNEYLGTIDALKFTITDKDSEINLLREEYDTLKQKYMTISRKVANG